MIIVRTPLRVSFFGGGTDFPQWYKKFESGGSVISTSINKYCYIQIRYLKNYFDHKYRIRYFINEERNRVEDINHPIVNIILRKYLKKNNKDGIEIVHNADLPARTGLGSSSAFTVSLLNSVYCLNNTKSTKKKIWEDAIHIEQNLNKEFVGSQDQIACTMGGFNQISFRKDNINIKNLKFNSKKIKLLEKHLSLFFLGFNRDAKKIEKDKIKKINKLYNYYKDIGDICNEAKLLFKNKNNTSFLDDFGFLLNQQWNIKKKLSRKVTNNSINETYEWGMKNGAIGGKLLGAGGGGFFLFLSKNKSEKIKLLKSFKKLEHVEFKFENSGTTKIYENR